jgi:VanZ family protein
LSVAASEKSFLDKFLAYWLPVLVMLTGIVVLSAQPHLKPPIEFPQSDKMFHALEYGTLGFLLARAVRGSLPRQSRTIVTLIAVGIGATVGVGDEYFQSFVPGRECSALDWAADVGGLILGQIVYRWRVWR